MRAEACRHEWTPRDQGPGFRWLECWLCGEQTDYLPEATTDPDYDWGPLAAAAFAEARALQGRPPIDPADDLAAYRAAEGKSRAAEGDDSAAEVIAENRLAVRIDADPRSDDRAADVFYDKRWGIA